MFNLARLFLLLVFYFVLYPFLRNRSIYCFLRFAGPSFIKLGQILSVRPDLVGENLARTLSSFQDSLPAFSEKEVRKVLNSEYSDFTKIFLEFDFQAISAASIAQVHKATTFDGKRVAVKILRPRIDKIVVRDIDSLKIIIKGTRVLSKFLAKSLSDIALLLEELAKSELDLLQEAANASKLKEDLKNVKGFYVPEVFWKFSTKKVLVLEFIDGVSFSNKEVISESNFDKKKIAENFVVSYFTQVYGNGFFHADMHPGNLFLMKNGDVAVVDFGIMGMIDKKTRIAVAEILIGFLNKDYKRVAQVHIEAGLVPKDVNVDSLSLSCRKIGETIVGANVRDISLASLLENLLTMTRDYNMVTKPELLLLQKTLLLVEGVGVLLDKDLNMWQIARPWLKEWAKKNIGFDAKIRDVLWDLIGLAKDFIRSV